MVVPPGRFALAGVRMYSHTTLLLQRGAQLWGSDRCEDYPIFPLPPGLEPRDVPVLFPHYFQQVPPGYRRALISAYGAEDIAIIGEGDNVIDGADCFDPQGEEGFRARERAALEKTAQTPNLIVATGGGAILREENVDIMHRAGLILFIDRPVEHILEDIDFSGRPMLREGAESVRRIHEARYPLYRQRCDVILDNRYEDEDDAAQMVLRLFQTDKM